MLAPLTGPTEDAMPWLNAHDKASVIAFGSKQYNIARHDYMPLIGGQRLQQATYRAVIELAQLSFDPTGQPVHAEHPPGFATCLVDIEVDPQAGLFAFDRLADNRAFPCQLALAGNTFAAHRFVIFKTMGMKFACEIMLARARFVFLAKLGTNFFFLWLLRHRELPSPEMWISLV
ncbi:MAG: hypothetical protein QGF59_17435 [Pirellulaceae bacterium]|nr:hypothetical protein [Pirellulaceae bacterium]